MLGMWSTELAYSPGAAAEAIALVHAGKTG